MENVTEKCPFLLEVEDQSSTELNYTGSVTIDPTVNFLFNGLGILFLAIFGITANMLSVLVLGHPKMKSSLTTLLLGLTISDVFVIFTSLLIFSLSQVLQNVNLFHSYTTVIRPYLLPWLLPIALTAQMSSLYFTVIITLERYIAVCLPLRARSLCTRSSAYKFSLAVVLISILYNIPRWFEYKTVPESRCGNQTTYVETETEFRKGDNYILYYVNWGYLVVIYLVPFTILLHFNTAIYFATRKHRSRRNSLSPTMASNQNEDIQLAGMLFGIVITFIACNMLALVINVMESFGLGEIGNLIPINNFLIVCSSSTNFVFYCVFGTEFRRRLRHTLKIRPSDEDDDSKRKRSSCVSYVMSTSMELVGSPGSGCQQQQQPHINTLPLPDDSNNNGANRNFRSNNTPVTGTSLSWGFENQYPGLTSGYTSIPNSTEATNQAYEKSKDDDDNIF